MESSQECQAHNYRLQKINEIQTTLTNEVEKRTKLSKKYHKWVKIVGGADDVLVGSIMVIETIAVALLATTIAFLFFSSHNSNTSSGNRNRSSSNCWIADKKKLSRKEGKHERIAVLAEGKLSAVSDRILKALDDGEISEEEYSFIVSELDTFREMKEEIRAKAKDATTHSSKESIRQRLSRVMTTK